MLFNSNVIFIDQTADSKSLGKHNGNIFVKKSDENSHLRALSFVHEQG